MFKRKLSTDDWLQVAVNLLPLAGVWFWGWDPKMMFLVYVCETIIIGVFNVLKMFLATLVQKKDLWSNGGASTMVSGYFFILFFILHYGFFVFIQTSLFFGVSSMHEGNSLGWGDLLRNIWKAPTLYAMISFILMYGMRMIHEFILPGKFRDTSLSVLMFSPYMRIFIQQFVVILGSFVLSFGAGKIFMLIFVLVKIYFDVFLRFDRILSVYSKKMQVEEEIKKKDSQETKRMNDRVDDILGR